jgi:hypothetical protein
MRMKSIHGHDDRTGSATDLAASQTYLSRFESAIVQLGQLGCAQIFGWQHNPTEVQPGLVRLIYLEILANPVELGFVPKMTETES